MKDLAEGDFEDVVLVEDLEEVMLREDLEEGEMESVVKDMEEKEVEVLRKRDGNMRAKAARMRKEI